MRVTKQVGIRSDRGHTKTTASRTNQHPKMVLKLILGLSPQWHQQPPWRTPVPKPSLNCSVPAAWITEPVIDSWLKHFFYEKVISKTRAIMKQHKFFTLAPVVTKNDDGWLVCSNTSLLSLPLNLRPLKLFRPENSIRLSKYGRFWWKNGIFSFLK